MPPLLRPVPPLGEFISVEIHFYIFGSFKSKWNVLEQIRSLSIIFQKIDREAKQLGIELDKYMRRIEDGIRQSALTDPLKTQVLTGLDVVAHKGMGWCALGFRNRSR